MKRLMPVLLLVFLAGCAIKPAGIPSPTSSVQKDPANPDYLEAATWVDSLRSIQLLDDRTGWAFGPGAAYRTTDGGANWDEVRRPDAKTSTSSEMKAVALDRDHAWVAEWQLDGTALMVWGTADGGHKWTPVQVELASQSVARVDLGFLNATDGWLLTSSSPAAGLMSKSVYRTNTGGRDWNLVACSCPGKPARSTLSAGGMYPTGMAFRDDANGWLTGTYHGGDFIPAYHTGDGGKTWALQRLRLPSDLQTTYGNALQPTFFGPQGEKGLLPVILRMQDSSTFVPFATKDSGHTWALGGTLPANHCGSDLDCQVVAVDTVHIWVLEKDGPLHRTEDGGNTWDTLARQAKLIQVTFGSAAKGLGRAQSGSHQVLLQSSDGGQTWMPLEASRRG